VACRRRDRAKLKRPTRFNAGECLFLYKNGLEMNIQTEKLNLIEWISQLNDTSVIKKLKGIREDYSKSTDWWETLKKEELESINRGLKDFEEGRVHSHETARKIYEKYL
jgi:hypothetical protein